MKKVILALSGILAFFFCLNGVLSKERYWIDYAEQLTILKEHYITALAIANNHLYIATGEQLFTANLDGSALTEVTQKIKKEPKDQITEILVDSLGRELWIALNGSLNSALGYSYDLDIKQPQSTFLNRTLQLYEMLSKNAPQHSSISTLAFDGYQAVVGFFKGNIYLYSTKDNSYRLAYKPTTQYNWPVSAVLTATTAFIAVPGDGLIVIDRKTANAARFSDKTSDHIQTLAVDSKDLYIGAKGLYKAKISDFIKSSD